MRETSRRLLKEWLGSFVVVCVMAAIAAAVLWINGDHETSLMFGIMPLFFIGLTLGFMLLAVLFVLFVGVAEWIDYMVETFVDTILPPTKRQ